MSEPFIAEIKIFAGNFAPRGYAFCNGQLMQISQNTALFSLVGTTYGGDGRTTFGLPDLRDRAPLHSGTGPGLTQRRWGYKSGESAVAINQAQMPVHTHTAQAGTSGNPESSPAGHVWGKDGGNALYRSPADINTDLHNQAVESVGASQAHNNMQPYLTLNFIIALVGLYPSRN